MIAIQPATEFIYIPDLIGDVVASVATALGRPVYYDKGHYKVVEGNLVMKDGAISDEARAKYPLIWLVMDFEETFGRLGLNADLSASFIIATGTEATYTMDERRDKSFLPTLYPIYYELLKQLGRSRSFQSVGVIPNTKIDRPYWGVPGKDKNMFSDFIDAIEIKNLKISVKSIC